MAVEPAPLDVDNLRIIRANVRAFLTRVASAYRATSGRLLDIAPQVHEGARPFFPSTVAVETLDIDPNSGCTYIGDICARNDVLPDGSFDYVVCTEVLEHTLRPWNAADEPPEVRAILVRHVWQHAVDATPRQFADQIVHGEMHFDYRMRPGVVPHSNALALMRAIGLEV